MPKKSTAARQKAIQELVSNCSISDQKQLVDLLKKRYRIEANQAIVSRDLRSLGIVKKNVNGVFIYEPSTIDVSSEILRLALVDIQHNESLIVVKTQPGLASFVGDYIDSCTDLDLLGCLAGENVVFVTPKSTKRIQLAYDKLSLKLHFKKR